MAMREGERRRDISRDSKEWTQRRIEIAFREAQRMLAKKDDFLQGDVGELANYLLKMKSDYIDKLVEREFRSLSEGASKRASSAEKHVGALGLKSREVIASGYRKLKEQRDSSAREMQDAPRKAPDGRSSTSTKPSLKEVLRDAHDIRSQRGWTDTKEKSDTKRFQVGVRQDGSFRDIKRLAESLREEVEKSGKRLSFHNLNLDYLDTKALEKFRQSADENRRVLEERLREQIQLKGLHEELKIGLVDNRVYVWKVDRTPNDMLNVWGDRYFYFKEDEYAKIIKRLCSDLRLPEDKSERAMHLNSLIQNMISEDSTSRILHRKAKPRLVGDMLHFTRDVLGVENSYFEGKMTKVASRFGRGAINNPKLATGEEVESLRAKLGAIVNSDCWIGKNGIMWYYEGNVDRIRMVEKYFQQFGDMDLKMQQRETNTSYRMPIPRHVGKAFIYWGFTTDDKSIRNQRLVESIREGSRDGWISYLRELIPEDGSFNKISGFQWSRSVVMNPGVKDGKYNLTPELSDSHIAFIKDNGRHNSDRGYFHLQLSEYLKLDEKSKPDIVKSFEVLISKSRCKLIDDEASLAEKLGIKMKVYPESITLYEGSGRISIKWVATTLGKDNAIRWYLIAPPNDLRKLGLAQDWINQRPKDVQRVKKQLEEDGLLNTK
jgi:hypothetical protein